MIAPRRSAAVAILLAGLVAFAALAQSGKPLRILVGYSAGGAVDALARSVGQQIVATSKETVIVENKPGASTNIAVKALIDSPPDGQTLLMAANALAANGALFDPPPFDIARDIVPVAMVGRVPVVIATSVESKIDSLAKLIDAAKKQPHTVTRDVVISKCGWSPFEGSTFRSSIAATWVNGHLAWRDGGLDDSQLGRRLEFDR